jgi:hypothetical protein
LIKLLPYNFQIFYQKGTLNPADGPSRRPDYLADAEEVNQTPVSQLLPTLSARIAHRELEKQSSKPKMGSTKSMSPITGKNLKPKMGSTKGISPITGKNSEDNGLPANMEETSTPEFLLNGAGKSEALTTVGKVKEVQAVNNDAEKDLGILHLQAVTRHQARISAESLVPGKELPGSLIKLIRKHQEQDPYCKQIARQAFHPCWQPNLASAIIGPGSDNYTIQTFIIPGGIRDLLCVVHHVIMPM